MLFQLKASKGFAAAAFLFGLLAIGTHAKHPHVGGAPGADPSNPALACQHPNTQCIYVTKGIDTVNFTRGSARTLGPSKTGVTTYLLPSEGAMGAAYGCNNSRAFFNLNPGSGEQGFKTLDLSGPNNVNMAGFWLDDPTRVVTHGTGTSVDPGAKLFLYCYDPAVDAPKEEEVKVDGGDGGDGGDDAGTKEEDDGHGQEEGEGADEDEEDEQAEMQGEGEGGNLYVELHPNA